ncbi:uncharacterized protein BROUX77_006647 [Berkeleyomyces rouxiae]|uniref:uncharacterized protein n=1 Tax=Berkeleyomyces rouxiae TaxID=2035830 RepID=UPI003B7C780F
MPTGGPVPSRAAINTLRSIIFGTSCSLALVAEERRRRTDIAWTLVENGRLLHSQRCYHSGGLATVRAKFDASGAPTPASGPLTLWDDPVAAEWQSAQHEDTMHRHSQQRRGQHSAVGAALAADERWVEFPHASRPLNESLPLRRAGTVFENTKSVDSYMILGSARTGLQKQPDFSERIDKEQDSMSAAIKRLEAKLQESNISSQELQKLLEEAYTAGSDLQVLPTEFLEMSRSVQYILRTRGNSEAAAKALLRLVEDPRVEKASLLSHYPGDLICEILSIEDMLYMSDRSKMARFKMAGEILAGMNGLFRAHHRKRHNRMCDIICRVLQLDNDDEISRVFLQSCGSQASQVAHDIAERYAAKYPADAVARWQTCREANGVAHGPIKIRYINPPRHTPAIDALMGTMKLSIKNGRLEEAVGVFEAHVQRKGRRSNACLALALQSADTLMADPFCKRSLRLLRKAAHAKYNIEEEMSRLIAKRFDHLEKTTPASEFGNGHMYAHASTLLASMRDFCRNPGFLAYNRMARACLTTRDYIGAIRLCLASTKKHGGDDLFAHAFIVSNLVFALSALGEYNLLHILLLLLDKSQLCADETVRRALLRARKRLAVAAGSALWDKTRAQHMAGVEMVAHACQRIAERRGRTETDTEAGSDIESDDEPSLLQQGSDSVKQEGTQIMVETEFGRFTSAHVVSLLGQLASKWKASNMMEANEEAERTL